MTCNNVKGQASRRLTCDGGPAIQGFRTCACGAEFAGPKGLLECSWCQGTMMRIVELERGDRA